MLPPSAAADQGPSPSKAIRVLDLEAIKLLRWHWGRHTIPMCLRSSASWAWAPTWKRH